MKITLKPELIRWARERAGQSIPELANKLKVSEDRVAAWETTGELTLAQAERLAGVTYTPLGLLFLKEPPEEKLPVRDFRTVGTQSIQRPSPDLLEVINDALLRQDWYREYAVSNGIEPLEFIGSLTVSADVVGAAAQIRSVVKWDGTLRAEARTWELALTQQVEAVEAAGILVMRSGIVGNNTHRKLEVNEFRGFALSDDYAPLIFLNGRDAKAGQMFTLAHELVHLFLGLSGVSNLQKTYAPNNDTERFCNAVAAELLVPASELQAEWERVKTQTNYLALLTRHFKVSSLVILRRLRDSNFITDTQFEQRYVDELTQIDSRSNQSSGGDFYRTLRSRLGTRFVSALVESTLEGTTLYRDAFQLLGVSNSEKLRRLAQEVGVIS